MEVGRIKLGMRVVLQSGVEGIVTYFKNNEEIGVNTGHYPIVWNTWTESDGYKAQCLIELGTDTVINKSQITRVIEYVTPSHEP